MRFKIFVMLAAAITFYSCSTKQFVFSSSPSRPDKKSDFLIVSNDTSMIIPVGVYPVQKIVQSYVVKMRPAIARIDSLIYHELTKKGLSARIVNKGAGFQPGANYVTYQDYWAWDFKKYMHVLKIYFYDPQNGNKIMEVVSQGNTMGLHDYPNPKKQIPGLIEKALNFK